MYLLFAKVPHKSFGKLSIALLSDADTSLWKEESIRSIAGTVIVSGRAIGTLLIWVTWNVDANSMSSVKFVCGGSHGARMSLFSTSGTKWFVQYAFQSRVTDARLHTIVNVYFFDFFATIVRSEYLRCR